jgi:prepilin-type N-terminal cleavage/methylation domain-containing protein
MSRFIQKQGFTLIELMVVIVIIGVLASLAIPRFTEASSKAKVAEAPRVLASYESAYLAAIAETSDPKNLKESDLIFDKPTDSKWFKYAVANGTDVNYGAGKCEAEAAGDIGKFPKNGKLVTDYGDPNFAHYADGGDKIDETAKKMVPNFCNGSAKDCKKAAAIDDSKKDDDEKDKE